MGLRVMLTAGLMLGACAAGEPSQQVRRPGSVGEAEVGTAAAQTDENTAPAEESTAAVGVTVSDAGLTFKTEAVKLEPGEERYTCFTSVLEEDVVVDRYEHAAQPVVHHVVFVRTLKPEPDGFSECDVLFRDTWDPLYITGAGASVLQFPSDVGHKLSKGTQLLAQLHLLNAGSEPAEQSVTVRMRRSESDAPESVGSFVFGTTQLDLPPSEVSSVVADCTVEEPLQLIAAFPHMHQLGRKLRFEGGKTLDAMQPLFVRDPYDFDDQHIEPVELDFEPGDVTRVTCDYENTTNQRVTFGESTHEEMCFFIAFARGRERLSGCTNGGRAR